MPGLSEAAAWRATGKGESCGSELVLRRQCPSVGQVSQEGWGGRGFGASRDLVWKSDQEPHEPHTKESDEKSTGL